MWLYQTRLRICLLCLSWTDIAIDFPLQSKMNVDVVHVSSLGPKTWMNAKIFQGVCLASLNRCVGARRSTLFHIHTYRLKWTQANNIICSTFCVWFYSMKATNDDKFGIIAAAFKHFTVCAVSDKRIFLTRKLISFHPWYSVCTWLICWILSKRVAQIRNFKAETRRIQRREFTCFELYDEKIAIFLWMDPKNNSSFLFISHAPHILRSVNESHVKRMHE